MALPLSVFKSLYDSSLSCSDDNSSIDETESKQHKPLRRKDPTQSSFINDMQSIKQTFPDQVGSFTKSSITSLHISTQGTLTTVQAVRVNSQAFILSENRSRFEAITIPQNDSIFNLKPSSLTEVLKIKLVGRPLNTNHYTKLNRLSNTNFDAQHLFRCCNVHAADHRPTYHDQREWDRNFGEYELSHDIMGPMILARSDKAPLHVLHAMAILSFAENKMTPLFDHYQIHRKTWRSIETHFEHQNTVMQRRLKIKYEAKPDKFARFWEGFKEQTVHGHPEMIVEDNETAVRQQLELWEVNREELKPRPEWAWVPSPYDVTMKMKGPSFGEFSG